jgi:transposase InsO family protein
VTTVQVLTTRLSHRQALTLVGMARSTWHYHQHPRPKVATPVPHTARRSDRWLTGDEEATILAQLDDPAAPAGSVGERWAHAFDAGLYVASLRTWYRVARRHARTRPPRPRAPRPVPRLCAAAPHAVWCWDITWLPTPIRGQHYACYVVLDVYSRMVVAWHVAARESAAVAADLFATATARLGVTPRIVHADGGAAMTSQPVQHLFAQLGIAASHSRPSVPNDNPYSEAWFKTAKHHPTAPPVFGSLTEAQTWLDRFVPWYNHEHRHGGLGWQTPANVLSGQHRTVTCYRQQLLDAAHAAHPARYHQPPRAPAVPTDAWINRPTD